jgi:hypothetical protein
MRDAYELLNKQRRPTSMERQPGILMSSNHVVTYIDMGLNSVEEYWGELIIQSVRKFQAEPSTATLFTASLNAWHLHDWVWHDQNPGENSRGTAFSLYRDGLTQACPELGWLRDIADASKHRGLGRLPEVKGAAPRKVGTPIGLLLSLTREVLQFVLVLNDGSQHPADEVLRTAIEFWRRQLASKQLPCPYS